MELSARKKAVLTAIIKAYIASGEPVGSKILCEILENAPSSATLRNEMSSLCEMGLLEQPHTSAGRIPTHAAYRFYVESLMRKDKISEESKQYINSALDSTNCDPEKIPETAGKVLSEITGLTSIAANISGSSACLKRVELLPMGTKTLLMIIITSDGRSRSRLCHLVDNISDKLIAAFDRLVNTKILKRPLDEFTPAAMQNLFIYAGGAELSFMPLISKLFEMVAEIRNSNISLSGQTRLFSIYNERADAENIISLINKRDTLINLLGGEKDAGIVFGSETPYFALKPSSIVFSKYKMGKNNIGCIGVLGPIRMSYEQIIPSIEYTAQRIGCLLNETLKDMED